MVRSIASAINSRLEGGAQCGNTHADVLAWVDKMASAYNTLYVPASQSVRKEPVVSTA